MYLSSRTNSAISTENAEKVVKAPQNPVVAPVNHLLFEENPPTRTPRTPQPATLTMKTCQGHAPVTGSISNKPHLAQAPRMPPRITEIKVFLSTHNDATGET